MKIKSVEEAIQLWNKYRMHIKSKESELELEEWKTFLSRINDGVLFY